MIEHIIELTLKDLIFVVLCGKINNMRNTKLIIILSIVATLLVAIIVTSATFLVRHIDAYNYYEENSEYDQLCIDASGIKNGKSMFFIDEQKVIENIEKKYPNVNVINVERKFPDRVSINYVVCDNLFQFLNGDKYYQCYSSGKIGSASSNPVGGYFLVRVKGSVNTTVGQTFQNKDGNDYKLINRFVSYMRSTGLSEAQMVEMIDFIDLTRDNYFYIRTKAGCSIEVKGTGEYFEMLLDKAWSVFVNPSPNMPTSKGSGKIYAYVSLANPDSPHGTVVYDKQYNELDYQEDYLS